MVASRPPAFFLADSLGLDFLNSVATPPDEDTIDWIGDGEALLLWLEQAGLVPGEVLQDMRSRSMPGELDRVADQARNLREWFRSFVSTHMGKTLPPEAIKELGPINRLLERDELFGQLVSVPQSPSASLAFRHSRRWRSPESLLLPIGEILSGLLSRENFVDVKACQGDGCTLVFVDHTRSKARRWCSMAACGNRAKQAAHRIRLRTNPSGHPQ